MNEQSIECPDCGCRVERHNSVLVPAGGKVANLDMPVAHCGSCGTCWKSKGTPFVEAVRQFLVPVDSGTEVQNQDQDSVKGGESTVAAAVVIPQDNSSDADPTQFITRSFAMVWNEGHSIRLINRDDPRKAISIPWGEIPALRALLKGTYPVGGGEV